jgi:hypothetical protein
MHPGRQLLHGTPHPPDRALIEPEPEKVSIPTQEYVLK